MCSIHSLVRAECDLLVLKLTVQLLIHQYISAVYMLTIVCCIATIHTGKSSHSLFLFHMKVYSVLKNYRFRYRGRSRIFQRGAPTLQQVWKHKILPNFLKNCIKLKEFEAVLGTYAGDAPQIHQCDELTKYR